MKKTMMAMALCLMSAISFAGNRQVSTTLPAETPSVTITQDGKQRVVHLTKAVVKEADASHVRCTVYAGKDKAEVVLPISYNTVLDLGYRAAETAYSLNLINAQQWQTTSRAIGCKPAGHDHPTDWLAMNNYLVTSYIDNIRRYGAFSFGNQIIMEQIEVFPEWAEKIFSNK